MSARFCLISVRTGTYFFFLTCHIFSSFVAWVNNLSSNHKGIRRLYNCVRMQTTIAVKMNNVTRRIHINSCMCRHDATRHIIIIIIIYQTFQILNAVHRWKVNLDHFCCRQQNIVHTHTHTAHNQIEIGITYNNPMEIYTFSFI